MGSRPATGTPGQGGGSLAAPSECEVPTSGQTTERERGGAGPLGGHLAGLGLRRLHHVLIELGEAGATCTLAGVSRTPVRRRIPLGVALRLAEDGVPTYITGGS